MAEQRIDVLVIGSGAAGAAVSKRLTDLGARVMCLEQGDWLKPGEYPSTFSQVFRPDRQAYDTSPNVRKRHEDYPVTTAGANPPRVDMFNAVGGTTIHWAGCFPRFHPSDFRVKTLDGVGDDWPITYRDLEPYYDMNDREMGVSGLQGDPANPPRSPRPTPALPLDTAGRIIARGFNKLGWHWWPCDNAIISRNYDGRPGCKVGVTGCPLVAKASTDVTYWPKALAKGAVLKTGARVREISVDEHRGARGVLYYDRQGILHEQQAHVVIVACNGIGTPRLLLNSKSKWFPEGVANSSGMVGKNFMTHLWRFVTGTFSEPLDVRDDLFTGVPIFSQQFYETDAKRGFVRGYSLGMGPTGGSLFEAWGAAWGAEHHRDMRKRFRHRAGIFVIGEDLPDERNCVELDAKEKDSDGIPAARVTYGYNDNSRKMLEHGVARAREVLEAAGATDIRDEGSFSWACHLMGTARMGNDPRRSVVNAWHQAHDVKNLFIVDGSSFTTGAGVNPTSTIGALALRCGDGIWKRRREFS